MRSKIYQVRILDFKYLTEFENLNFRYLNYKVQAEDEKSAIQKARELYMKGQKEIYSEELPILLKLFSVNQT